ACARCLGERAKPRHDPRSLRAPLARGRPPFLFDLSRERAQRPAHAVGRTRLLSLLARAHRGLVPGEPPALQRALGRAAGRATVDWRPGHGAALRYLLLA